MQRRPEPELMDDPAQARAYAEADFAAPHEAFVDEFQAAFPGHDPRRVLDLGCGPADVTLRFARRYPQAAILGVDGARAMLALGHAAVAAEHLDDRISFVLARLPGFAFQPVFDTVISNSLLHHLADPAVLWDAIKAACGASVFVMDLRRPDSERAAQALVEQYAANEAPVLKQDFYRSLLAAYAPQEIVAQLQHAGLGGALRVRAHGDRHVIVWGAVP